MSRSAGTISVTTFAEPSRRSAETDLRKQLKAMARENGVKLMGTPTFNLREALGLWGGTAKQDYRED